MPDFLEAQYGAANQTW